MRSEGFRTMTTPGQGREDEWAGLSAIERSSVPDEIVQRLTAFILEAGLTAGARMPSERQLMTQLAVGRSSLREAIKTLSSLGIVRVAGGDGMYVGDGRGVITKPVAWGLLVGQHQTRDVIEARRAVEMEMAGLAALRATPREVRELGDKLGAMQDAIPSPEQFTELDTGFHMLIARIADNTVLAHVLETLQYVVRAWIFRTFTEFPEYGHGSYNEHVPIFEAIRDHDAAAARQAMGAHLDAAAGRLLKVLERTGGT